MAGAFTRFRFAPSPQVQAEWMDTIARTGQPELCEGLYTGQVPNDAEYKILRRVHIDPRKRPKRDRATCSMCTPNRFLHGSLVHVADLECACVVGNCCAKHAEQAERRYEREQLVAWEEEYLLAALPDVASKQKAVIAVRGIAEEVQRIYRRLRNNSKDIHLILRNIKDRNNARLTLYEAQDTSNDNDYVGPAGYRRQSDTRVIPQIEFGSIIGTTALIRDYKPVYELDAISRNIGIFDFAGDELEAIDLIGAMTAKERRAAVATLQIADDNYEKFISRIKDCVSFFSGDSVARLDAFGSHHLNHQPFAVTLKPAGARWNFELTSPGSRCFISIDSRIFSFDFPWKVIRAKKRS
jgi:hypothetical protein